MYISYVWEGHFGEERKEKNRINAGDRLIAVYLSIDVCRHVSMGSRGGIMSTLPLSHSPRPRSRSSALKEKQRFPVHNTWIYLHLESTYRYTDAPVCRASPHTRTPDPGTCRTPPRCTGPISWRPLQRNSGPRRRSSLHRPHNSPPPSPPPHLHHTSTTHNGHPLR